MGITLWEVHGSFIIPGTRDKGSFGPVRVVDETKQKASKHLAALLRIQFRKELARANQHGGPKLTFGDDFPLMQLQWKVYVSPRKQQELDAAKTATVTP